MVPRLVWVSSMGTLDKVSKHNQIGGYQVTASTLALKPQFLANWFLLRYEVKFRAADVFGVFVFYDIRLDLHPLHDLSAKKPSGVLGHSSRFYFLTPPMLPDSLCPRGPRYVSKKGLHLENQNNLVLKLEFLHNKVSEPLVHISRPSRILTSFLLRHPC